MSDKTNNPSVSSVINAMSVDVEDYFQVSAFEKVIARADWERVECRVEANTNRVLDLFNEAGIKGTFFILGWVAERYPSIVRRIINEGHELASHGYGHQRVTTLTPEIFREDIRRTKILLEDLSAVQVKGYRAPSYSISMENLWAHDILGEEGYIYSSSVYPVRHDLYGIPDAPRYPYRTAQNCLTEIPISTFRSFGKNFPIGGGGYFRLLPYAISRQAILNVNNKESQACVFYFHPWEIDPNQPRQSPISLKTRFRHYLNLGRMESRLQSLLRDFSWDRVDRVYAKYLPN